MLAGPKTAWGLVSQDRKTCIHGITVCRTVTPLRCLHARPYLSDACSNFKLISEISSLLTIGYIA